MGSLRRCNSPTVRPLAILARASPSAAILQPAEPRGCETKRRETDGRIHPGHSAAPHAGLTRERAEWRPPFAGTMPTWMPPKLFISIEHEVAPLVYYIIIISIVLLLLLLWKKRR